LYGKTRAGLFASAPTIAAMVPAQNAPPSRPFPASSA
jgi:hypothetical protein